MSTALHTSIMAIFSRDSAQAVAQGAIMSLYRFTELKTVKPDRKDIRRFTLIEDDPSRFRSHPGARIGQTMGESVCFARDLVNLPANIMTPLRLWETAQSMADAYNLKAAVLDETDITRLGMNAFMSVARGSHNPPRFIILEHNHGRADIPAVALVGKAVTFDSGGISLKPGAGMEAMKGDMAGAAAVRGPSGGCHPELARENHALIPAAENMPGGGRRDLVTLKS